MMGKILVLAEKPSVGKELARVLGCKKSGGGFIEGENYIVTWALGHLVTLAEPEAYGEQYKTWSMETLPMMPEKMQLKVIPETAKQFGVVKKLLTSKEVSSCIIATDAGREGELVVRWILKKVGFQKPIQRLWISSQTDKAIKEGFAKLKNGKEYDTLYQSAQARAEADWLVGLNVTRALTCKYNAQLSAGRVQTPTLAMIVKREEEIKKFVPKEYFIVRADLGKFFVTYRG
jgi:DNA topoisomerase-3